MLCTAAQTVLETNTTRSAVKLVSSSAEIRNSQFWSAGRHHRIDASWQKITMKTRWTSQ